MSLHHRKNGWGIQLRIGQNRRPWFVIEAPSEPIAEQRAAVMTEMAALLVANKRYAEAEPALRHLAASQDQETFDGGAEAIRELCAEPVGRNRPKRAKAITFEEFGEQWTSGALAKRYGTGYFSNKKSANHDASRLKTLYAIVVRKTGATLGSLPLVSITADDCYEAMSRLPPRVKTESARKQYAQVIFYLLQKAANPCRIIERSPLEKGFVPKPSTPPKYPFLYPAEDLVLCGSALLELGYRLLYGFAAREGGRKTFLQLCWRNLDLENGFLIGGISKNGEVLDWEMFPGTRDALVAYRKGLGDPRADALVFPPMSETHQAELFRKHLKLVGLTRHELFEESPGREPIRFHDLRASFITVALANNRTEAWIQRRTGHTTSQMINRYRRDAERIERLGDWARLDVALGLSKLPEPAPDPASEPPQSASPEGGVAYRVAYKLSGDSEEEFETAENMLEEHARPLGGMADAGDLKAASTLQGQRERLKNSPSAKPGDAPDAPVSHPKVGGVAYTEPAFTLSSEQLVELLDLARSARRWHLMGPLGEALEALEQAREAEHPKVANLEQARRKRERGES